MLLAPRRSLVPALLSTALACWACSSSEAPAISPAPSTSASMVESSITGGTMDRHLYDDAVVESSGLARSTYDRDLLWTHNDSGDTARIFGVDRDGSTVARLGLTGAAARDWEDIATGPDHTLWIGDIGDNSRSRSTISVYKIAEPPLLQSGSVAATRYTFSYPEGPHDAEGLMVHPGTGRLYVVSKVRGGGDIYRAPSELSTSSTNRLTRVASAPPIVTGASFAPDGSSFVLVNYGSAYVYRDISATPVKVTKVNSGSQGESVEVNRAGTGMYLGQEGADSPVYRMTYPTP